jgi:ribosomal protein S15P/S13E
MPRKSAESDGADAQETVETVLTQPQAESKPAKAPKKLKKEATLSDLKPSQIEELVVELANQGQNASQIGTVLRDQHGVPKVKLLTGKTIQDILGKHKLGGEIPEDLMALIRRVVALDNHMQANKKDFSAKRGYQLTVSKIRRLVAYYHEKKRLPADWRYSIEKARLLVK